MKKTLRAIRRENECTVAVIAARARCSPSLVSNLEHGYSPPVWRAKNLADAYGLTVDQFWAAFSALNLARKTANAIRAEATQ